MAGDEFGLPRDPEHAIHGMVGEWETKAVWTLQALCDARSKGWEIVYYGRDHVTLTYFHAIQCGCGLEWGHDSDLMWVM